MAAEPVYIDWDDEQPLEENEVWRPEPVPQEDPVVIQRHLREVKQLPKVRPSQFTQTAFMMPTEVEEAIELRPFSFRERRHMLRCYDTPAKRILLMCGRQVEKSTLLGNAALCYSCIVPGYRTLFVSPSGRQTERFSKDRIQAPIDTSPILRRFTTTMLSQNILEKQFVNRSSIILRYAFLNADRTRGISAWMLQLDELQDILYDNIPVIEQCLSHAPERWKRYMYAGTPKTLDNTIEDYWAKQSTQTEWVVPCEGCNHWNILGEENIGKHGLICERCGKRIDAAHPRAQWATQVEGAEFEGYRIPQLMVPWRSWDEILLDYERYPRAKFHNEVLGRSFDSGLRPLSQAELRACCNAQLSIFDVESYRQLGFSQPIYAGVDWGTGENSYTVVTLATYINGKFRAFYMHRFTGREVEPDVQIELLFQLFDFFNVKYIGADYGGGFHPNDKLMRKYGKQRVWKYQYLGQLKSKVEWDGKLGRFKVRRNDVMADIFNAIKRGRLCEFPKWEEFDQPFAQDMLNIFSEYNDRLKTLQFGHAKDKPDDSFHSFLYAWLVSMLDYRRPDIISPDREDRQGNPVSQFIAPPGFS